MNTNCFNDQAKISDALSSQKFISASYNTCANEAAEPVVKNTMMSLLEEEHQIQHELFLQMQKRGWYQTEAAPQQKISETKSKFSTCCSC